MSNATENDFNVPVPTEELERKPTFELMTPGWYETTLQAGAEAVGNDNGWKGIRVPFAGFVSKKDATKRFDRDRRYQITTESASSPKAVEIGWGQLVGLAAAFGLTEDVEVAGKPAKRIALPGDTKEELVANLIESLNSVAGSPCDVYITAKKRERNGKVVMRDDGNGPVMDNEISRVAASGAGK